MYIALVIAQEEKRYASERALLAQGHAVEPFEDLRDLSDAIRAGEVSRFDSVISDDLEAMACLPFLISQAPYAEVIGQASLVFAKETKINFEELKIANQLGHSWARAV